MSGGIYVHVPWCRAICPYCGFDVVRDTGEVPWERYVDRVIEERELRRAELPGRPDTVYLGGGTPSRMPADALARLVRDLEPVDGAEITVELNPEDAAADWLDAARAVGVTRVSVGVQTLDPKAAKLLGRGHTSPQALDAIRRIRAHRFHSWSADLIFALPGQTLDALEADLDALLQLDPPHLSLYGLTFEPDTPFEARRRAGKLRPPPDELWRAMYDLLVDRLEAAGLQRYEVSNFARAGHRSRHNQGYWSGLPYLGLGPGAHGFGASGRRWINHADPATWLEADNPAVHEEDPTPEQAAIDHLLSALRTAGGLDLDALGRRTGHRPTDAAVQRLQSLGLLAVHRTQIHLTDAGFPIADSVIGALVEELAPTPPRTG